MASAQKLLKILQDKDLLPSDVLKTAQQMAATQPQMAEGLPMAMWLVQQQHLTAMQAQRLLAALDEPVSKLPPAPPAAPPPERPAQKPAAPAVHDDDLDLDLAPLEGEVAKPKAASQEKKPLTGSVSGKSPAHAAPPVGSNQTAIDVGRELEVGKGFDSSGGMKGPLDSLIDSELAGDESGPVLDSNLKSPPPSRKLKLRLRRFIQNMIKSYKSKTVRVKETDPRKVRLMLYSWGTAAVLVVAALLGFWAWSPPSSDDILKAAKDAEANKNYPEAIAQYDKFLKNYPANERAAEVVMRQRLDELRKASQDASSSGDWTKAYEVASKLVADKAKDRAFLDMQLEAGETVGTVGIGLAQQSEQQPTAKIVDDARRVAYMLQMNWSDETRPKTMIDEINHRLESGDRVVSRRNDLKTTLEAVKDAIERGDLPAAYLARNQAVERFPELIDDPELAKVFDQVSDKLRQQVMYTETKQAAATDERPSDVLGSLPLAVQPTQGMLEESKGKVIVVAVNGGVFGLDGRTGQVLWRRALVQDAALPIPPVILQNNDDDVILTDAANNEVQRLEAKTGRLLWRQAIAKPLAAGPIIAVPVPDGNRLLVVTQDQKMVVLDLVRGDVRGLIDLPQPVRLPPVVDAKTGYVFLTAETANLYVLLGTACRQVLHLGQDPGTIAALPLVAPSGESGSLLIAINGKKQDATLELLAICDPEANPPQPAIKLVTRLKIKGRVEAPLQTIGRDALVVTAEGGLQQYKLNPKGDNPLELVAEMPALSETRLARWPMVYERHIWVADRQLAEYEAPSEHGRIVPKEVTDAGSLFNEAPAIIPGGMSYVRKRPGMPGVIVAAVEWKQRTPRWQTWLGVPLAGEPLKVGFNKAANAGKLLAFTASGGMFRFPPGDVQGLRAGPQAELMVESQTLAQPIRYVTALADGMAALSSGSGSQQIALYDPKESSHRFHTMVAPSGMSSAPAGFGGGLLVPCMNGSVYLFNCQTLGELAAALPPPIEGLTNWAWQTPQIIDDKSVLLCDGDRRLFVVQVAAPPKTQSADADVGVSLKAVFQATANSAFASAVTVLRQHAYAVDAEGSVQAYSLPDLAPSHRGSLAGHKCVWGPRRAGSLMLLATDAGRLYAFDEEHEAWHVSLPESLPGSLPVGEPMAAAADITLSLANGTLWRIAVADGKERGRLHANSRLTTGPVEAAGHVFVGTRDGSVLQLK
jgi:outer membrane protein assembly factor BamB